MVRPIIKRCVEKAPQVRYYKPRGIPLRELSEVVITGDVFEAIRLVDLEGLYQDTAAEKMGVSRPTISRILAQGRKAIADALVNGKAIRIEGGNVTITPSNLGPRCKGRGRRGWR
ncbi:DUF134 domain-containing protein [bacterium]|nr:DUF134 domain-containing protein [bacterium]